MRLSYWVFGAAIHAYLNNTTQPPSRAPQSPSTAKPQDGEKSMREDTQRQGGIATGEQGRRAAKNPSRRVPGGEAGGEAGVEH